MQERLLKLRTTFSSGDLKRSMLEKYLDESDEAFELAVHALERARSLVQSFKQTAIDQISARRRRFDLAHLVSDSMNMLHSRYKDAAWTIVLEVDPDIQLNSFPGPLEQVVLNLVMNCIDHGFDGRDHGCIKISGHLEPGEKGNAVMLSVADDGVGIAPEHLGRVFDPFFTTKLGKGGSGMGLNFVHRMVSSILGGQISLNSTPGQGTTFTVRIPQKAPDKI